MKLLHSADWHLDAPLTGRTPEQAALLRKAALSLPDKIAELCRRENCDLMLLSGDLFDGPYTKESVSAVKSALAEAGVPVFIAPGNHDPYRPDSPWVREIWPENVRIFTQQAVQSVVLPDLDCRIYGAAFTKPYADGILEGFRANCDERYAIGIFHGDASQPDSPYCPITTLQVQESGLDYLAMGHIHKGGQFCAGSTLCAWPGCPMGRGYDETGEKGALIVTLEGSAESRFVPLGLPRFYDKSCTTDALPSVLPPSPTIDFYRITLTGESGPVDMEELSRRFSYIPNLEFRDRTVATLDIWGSAGQDTLEGLYFSLLHSAMEQQDEKTARQVLLAARISRQILNGQEVQLP